MLKFRQGGDSGYNESASVEPYDNAENANQTILRRPPENLRKRHEVLRKAFDHLEAVCGSDRGLQMMCDPDVYVTWNGISSGLGDGKFSITTAKELRIVPIISTAGEGAGSAALAQLRFEPDSIGHANEYFRVRSDLKAYEGGNNIFFELVAGGALDVTVNGGSDPAEGSVAIIATYVAGVTTWSLLVTELNKTIALGGADELITAWNNTGLAAVTIEVGDALAYQRLSDGTGADVVGYGGIDAEGFVLTAAQIVTFFAIAGNPLDEGDTLVLDFVDAVTRRTQVESDDIHGALQVVRYGAAAIASDDPMTGTVANLHAIPICKVFNGRLHFMNGVVVNEPPFGTGVGSPVSLMQIDSPFVIVGPGGHYTTVQAALTALGSTGGTIFIKNGIYTENLTLSNINYDITVIGEGVDKEIISKGVVLKNSGVTNLIIADVGMSSRVTFMNLRLEQDSAVAFLLAINESTLERARVAFHDCVFLHTSATADKLFDHTINLEFIDCYFKGTPDTGLNMATVFRPYALTNPGVTHLRVERCYFEKFAVLAEIGKIGTDPNVGHFIFCDNVIYDCCKTTAADAVGILIERVAAFDVHAVIRGNRWEDGVADTASGHFCSLLGKGEISNNILTRSVLGFVPAGVPYNIRAYAGATISDGRFTIENNYIMPGSCSAMSVAEADVRYNRIVDFCPAGGTVFAIGIHDDSTVIGNVIVPDAALAVAHRLIEVLATADRVVVAQNILGPLKADGVGIATISTALDVVIQGNIIRSAAAVGSVGVWILGERAIVEGNNIFDVVLGIQLNVAAVDDDNLIANNIIRLADVDNSHGIEVDAGCNGNAINGNVIRGVAARAGHIGIDLNACDNVVVVGNRFEECDTNIFSTGSTGCGVRGNEATATLEITNSPVQNDNVTIGSKVYTFKDIPGADGEVDVNANIAIAISNLIAAINLAAGEATKYGAGMTLHPTVTATQVVGDTAKMKVISKLPGGDAIEVTLAFPGAGVGTWDHTPLEYEEFTLAHNWW